MARIVLEQADIQQLEQLIVELPFKYAQPLLNFLQSKVKQDEQITETESE